MVKLDLKDRKILYQLDLDSRQSLSRIGVKVGLHKNNVLYRIKRMQDEGFIKYFWTAINTFRLGYNVFRIYINFQDVSAAVKQEIIQYFVNYRNSWLVAEIKGEVDLDVILWVKNNYEFHQFWNQTLAKYGTNFAKYAISLYIQAVCYQKSYLLLDEYKKADRKMYETTCDGKTVPIDELDYRLLNLIVVNARVPLVELARNLGCSAQTVNYRIKNLIKNGVIQAFRVHIDYSKLGLQHVKLDIYLKDHTQRNPVIKYLGENPCLEDLNVAIGWADLEPEFVVQNINELFQITDDINSHFPKAIRKQTFWIDMRDYKNRWLPEL